MRGLLGLMLLAVVVVAGGCHDDGGPEPPAVVTATVTPSAPPPRLTRDERRRLRRDEARIGRHCVRVSAALGDPSAAPTRAQQARAFAAADDLVAIARAKPTAALDVGQDVRLYLGDVVENLEGSNCDQRMVERLERGLATIPVE